MSVRDWPFLRQLFHDGDAHGEDALSERTRSMNTRARGAPARSVCAHTPELSGAASRELLTQAGRLTPVLHRAPVATEGPRPLDQALDRVARLAWNKRPNGG